MRNIRRISRIIMILFVSLGIGGTVIAYATTDFLKTDKQLFYKYLSQIIYNVENLKDEEVLNYLSKKQEVPYETKGKVTIKVEEPGLEEYINTEKLNNLNITFEGKEDKKNKISEYNIDLNYSEDISFPIKYKKTDETYGIKSELVVNKYIAVRNQELNNLLENMNISGENIIILLNIVDRINNKIKIEDLNGSLEGIDKKVIGNNFSKTGESTISLKLNKREAEEIISKTLAETNIIAQNDKSAIIDMIKNTEESANGELLEIIVNKSGKISFRIIGTEDTIDIETSKEGIIVEVKSKEEMMVFSLGKIENEEKKEYTLTYRTNSQEQNEIEAYLRMEYSNIENQSAKEICSFGIYTNQDGKNIQYAYKIEGENNFSNEIAIDRLENDNPTILNNLNRGDMSRLIQALKMKIEQINKIQMDKLGLNEDQNPLVYAIPMKYVDVLLKPAFEDENYINEQKLKEMEKIEARTFNVRFENYQGTQRATIVKTLISSVISNNLSNDNLISVNGMTNQTELTNFMNGLINNNTYIVTMGINEKGYINTIQVD